ncbi:MAG: hypothetical protein INR65_10765, partial [Gluconacetobacter diazotrophicus]|nr:hypothetical protein [Gluconacetobacter diazotrophicus]
MSGVSSTGLSIPIYLSAIANEGKQVALDLKSARQLAATVASFEKTAPTLGDASAILKNYKTLQVLTGAYNLSGQISRTAVLRTLMTQDPGASGSLVSRSANADYLHFARATEDRARQQAQLGPLSALVLPTGGAASASLTMQNTRWNDAGASATAPGIRWSFVLNDGSAGASVAASLNAAAKAGGLSTTYAIAADGSISGSPAVRTSRDSLGNTVYSLPLATDTS